MNRPFIRQMEKFPFAAALGISVVVPVFLFPAAGGVWCVPDDLRVGAYQYIISPALELLAAGGVQYFIIFPMICNPHKCLIPFRTSLDGCLSSILRCIHYNQCFTWSKAKRIVLLLFTVHIPRSQNCMKCNFARLAGAKMHLKCILCASRSVLL